MSPAHWKARCKLLTQVLQLLAVHLERCAYLTRPTERDVLIAEMRKIVTEALGQCVHDR